MIYFLVFSPRNLNPVVWIGKLLNHQMLWSTMKYLSHFYRRVEMPECHHHREQQLEIQLIDGKCIFLVVVGALFVFDFKVKFGET